MIIAIFRVGRFQILAKKTNRLSNETRLERYFRMSLLFDVEKNDETNFLKQISTYLARN